MLSDSDTESFHNLTINEHYAKAFQYKKEREELQKLKEKYGSDFDDDDDESEDDSESDESEDEDGQELTPNVDAAILRTLARIKRKDPAIYNTDKNIFVEEEAKSGSATKRAAPPKDKVKPVTIRQAALQSALLNPDSRSPSPEPLPHVEEQRALRNETILAFNQTIAPDDEDDILVLREKTRDEQEVEEEEYRVFLEREVGDDLHALISDDEVQGQVLSQSDHHVKETPREKKKQKKRTDHVGHAAGTKSQEQSHQDFLMNYILNRGWIDRSARHIPTYQEVVSLNSVGNQQVEPSEDREHILPTEDTDLDEEDFEEIVDHFESSYNFRFEEPDAAVIKSYPRQMNSLVRREDTTRKAARERKKQKKEEQIHQKKEEIKRLKNLKMKEVRSKLERIGQEGGKNLEDDALQALDLEGDWDPEAYDRQMANLYGDEDFDVGEKPHWDEEIDIGDLEAAPVPTSSKKKKKKKKNDHGDGETLGGVDVDAMDADVEKTRDDEDWDGTEEMRKRKLDEYMDEIYGLEFNDMIGDIPTRFKYVPVQPQNYNLTPVEILLATDQELNEYMGVKKYAPYRKEVKWDGKRNERLREFKSKLAQRTGNTVGLKESQGGLQGDTAKKKRMGKKERMKMKTTAGDADEGNITATLADRSEARTVELMVQKRKPDASCEAHVEHGKKKRRRKHK